MNDNAQGQELITLEIPKNDMGRFLSDLLGQRRQINKIVEGPFEIGHNFLCNLDDILEQRITGQQRAELMDFWARIHFSDNRARTETNRESFRCFNDLSTQPTIGADIIWTYLVWFPNRPTPEKQEVSLSIYTNDYEIAKAEERRSGTPSPTLKFHMWVDQSSSILVNLHFTELTWATDILHYIEQELEKTVESSRASFYSLRKTIRLLSPFIF